MLLVYRMKLLHLISILICSSLLISIYAQTTSVENPTHTYADCKFHSLKSKDKLDCIVEEFSGNEMNLYVYELENQTNQNKRYSVEST